MADPIRDALERAARELELVASSLTQAGWAAAGSRAMNEAHAARAALAAQPPAPAPASDGERTDPIRDALRRAEMSISGGLCYFTAEAKHAQLQDAERHLEDLRVALQAQPSPAPAAVPVARPADEWHEDMGPVLWWKFPVSEPPYCGTPLDQNPPWFSPGYYTHFTPLVVPQPPQGGEVQP